MNVEFMAASASCHEVKEKGEHPCAKLSTMTFTHNGGVETQFHTFLALAIAGAEWSASCLSGFVLCERASSTHQIGGNF
jgi:hypothetical protein